MTMSQEAAQALESVAAAPREARDAHASALIGTTLEGAYRINRLIAEGGMSAVYEATQLRLHQRVAVKVMARELASNHEALARFQREAEVTSGLRHPHLVTVMDFGTAPTGQPYLVMEYLDGIDLDRRIDQMVRLPLPMVVHITKQVASALAAAHEQGIVHRDLKPANIFLVELPGEPDFAKILDFGISKVRAAGTQLTKAQAIIGTPNYMSPEQATGMLDEIDPRTDQWALACIVWEMLSGRATFASDDMSAVFYQVIHLDPQPLRVPGLPAAVEAVLRRALSKNRDARFPSVRDFANALASAAEPPTAMPLPRVLRNAPGTPPLDAAWIERRRGGRERRREAAPPIVRAAGPTAGHAPTAPLHTSFWRKVKPVYALSVLTVVLAVVAVALLRWNPPAKAAVPTTAAPTAVAPPPAGPPRPTAPEQPSAAGHDETAASPTVVRPVKARPHSSSKATRAPDDPVDPFAPAPRRPARAGKADHEFVDPFGS